MAALQPEGVQAFQLTGAVGPAVWRVNGIEGGNEFVGTITADGRLSAPPEIPMALPVVVTAQVDDQTSGASVDVLRRQVLAENLGTVQSVAYLSGLQTIYTAEISTLAAEGALGSDPQQALSSTIFDVSSQPRQAVTTIAGEDIPKMVPFAGLDGNEYLLLAGRTTGQIYRLDPTDGTSLSVATGLDDPKAIVIDPTSGNLLVAEKEQLTTVSLLQLNQGLVANPANVPGRVTSSGRLFDTASASGIVVDQCSGDIYFSNADSGEIVAIRRDSGTREVLIGGLATPTHLAAFHRQGISCPFFQMLVVERDANQITQVTPSFSSAVPWVPSPGARDVIVLPAGDSPDSSPRALLAEIVEDVGRVVQVQHPRLDVRPINPFAIASGEPQTMPAGTSYFLFVADGRDADADGSTYETTFSLYNPGALSAAVSLEIFDETGNPLSLEIDGESLSSLNLNLQPGESAQSATSDTAGPAHFGYVRLTTDNPVLAELDIRLESVPEHPEPTDPPCETHLSPLVPSTSLLSYTGDVADLNEPGLDFELIVTLLNPDETEAASIEALLFDGQDFIGSEELVVSPRGWLLFSSDDDFIFPDVSIESETFTLTFAADRPIVSAISETYDCAVRVITPANSLEPQE